MINTGDAQRTQDQILAWIDGGAFDFESDVILCARNGETDQDPCTVRGLNAAIVAMISPRDAKRKFNTGDRVINTKNLPAIDAWNGTTGTVHAIDQDGGIWVKTDIPVIDWSKSKDDKNPVYTNHILFGKDTRKHLQLSYAMTVHRAQGSQYRNVLMCCFTRDGWGLLDRSLLYTGVTRTKAACCVVGELAAAWSAIGRVSCKRTIIQQLAGGN
jgi:exodeoxyribonuclease V alpha subunit